MQLALPACNGERRRKEEVRMTNGLKRVRRKRRTVRPTSRSRGSSLSEFVYQALIERIFDGRLPSGTLVSELALAGELNVSRTPVHDAVRQLAKDGLVTREGK